MANKTQGNKQLTRRQVARREKEHRAQQLITWIAAGLGIAILGILIYGVVTEVFIKARRPVATVGETAITTQAFKTRQEYERWMTQLQIYQYENYLSQLAAQQAAEPSPETTSADEATEVDLGMDTLIQQLQMQLSSLEQQLSTDMATVYGSQVLESMIEEELVRQEAEVRGLTVTDEEMEEQIGVMLGYTPQDTTPITETSAVTGTVTPTAEPEDFDDLYNQFKTNVLQAVRYSEKDFRNMLRASLLQDKLRTAMGEDVELEQDQVEVVIFSSDTEADAQGVYTRLTEKEEDPEALVEEFGTDEDETTLGYTLPWLPTGYLGPQVGEEIEQAAFNTPAGQASQPILASDGQYYVIYVKGHEVRELSEDLAAQAGDLAFEGWLSRAKEERVEYHDWENAVIAE